MWRRSLPRICTSEESQIILESLNVTVEACYVDETFYEFIEEVVTAIIEVRAFYGAMGMVVVGRGGFGATSMPRGTASAKSPRPFQSCDCFNGDLPAS